MSKINEINSFRSFFSNDSPVPPVFPVVFFILKPIASWFELGRFQEQLPLEVRRASVSAAFDVAEFMRLFQGRQMTEAL